MGHAEVARIEAEMKEIMKQLGQEVSLKQFIENLREDKSNFFTSKEELLAAGKEIVFDKIIIFQEVVILLRFIPNNKGIRKIKDQTGFREIQD